MSVISLKYPPFRPLKNHITDKTRINVSYIEMLDTSDCQRLYHLIGLK